MFCSKQHIFFKGLTKTRGYSWYTPEVKHSLWKMMVGRLLSFWDGIISGAMLNFRWVLIHWKQAYYHDWFNGAILHQIRKRDALWDPDKPRNNYGFLVVVLWLCWFTEHRPDFVQGGPGVQLRDRLFGFMKFFSTNVEVLENGCCFSTTHVLIEGELSETWSDDEIFWDDILSWTSVFLIRLVFDILFIHIL